MGAKYFSYLKKEIHTSPKTRNSAVDGSVSNCFLLLDLIEMPYLWHDRYIAGRKNWQHQEYLYSKSHNKLFVAFTEKKKKPVILSITDEN